MPFIGKIQKRIVSLPDAAKASVVFAVISFLQKGFGFITTPIYTGILTSNEYGRVSVYFSMESLIGTVAMFCLAYGCFDVGMQNYKEKRDSFVFSSLVLSNIITIITGVIVFCIYPFVDKYIGVSKDLLFFMFLGFVLSPSYTFWLRKERFEYKYRIPALLSIFLTVLSVVLSLLLILKAEHFKVQSLVVGQEIPVFIIGLIFWFICGHRAHYKIDIKFVKFAFLFCLPLIPHYISSYVLNSSDRLMISGIVGESQTAYYSVASNVASVVSVIWIAVNTSLVPYIMGKYEKKEYKQVSDTVMPLLLVYALVCLFVIMLAPEVVLVLSNEEYYEAIYVIPPIVGGLFFEAEYYLFSNILYYLKRPQYVMYASVSTAFLNIVLNYIFIIKFGYIAAGYTTLFCYMLQSIIDYVVSGKILGENIYDKKKVIVLSIVVVSVSLIVINLYRFYLLRYAVIALLVILAIVFRKTINNILFCRS